MHILDTFGILYTRIHIRLLGWLSCRACAEVERRHLLSRVQFVKSSKRDLMDSRTREIEQK